MASRRTVATDEPGHRDAEGNVVCDLRTGGQGADPREPATDEPEIEGGDRHSGEGPLQQCRSSREHRRKYDAPAQREHRVGGRTSGEGRRAEKGSGRPGGLDWSAGEDGGWHAADEAGERPGAEPQAYLHSHAIPRILAAVPKVGIVGASGYAGAELLRLCAAHPDLDVAWATGDRQAGVAVTTLYPNLAAVAPGMVFDTFEPSMADGIDAVFLALPHGASSTLVPDLAGRAGAVLDLAADFRLRDASLYPTWYGEDHPAPDLLSEFVYGLPELFDVGGATKIAVPGCYPTSAALALSPLLGADVIEPTGIIVDAASGVSGAGRDKYGFCAVDEDFRAYGLLHHRHTPEIEQAIGHDAQVLFTPHLVPMNRGILATCYARPKSETSTAALQELLHDMYATEPFVVVIDEAPSTKGVSGSNCAHVTARYDERTGWVVVLCAIDNLIKGAAGQAVQCANIVLGLEQTAGLPLAGMYP